MTQIQDPIFVAGPLGSEDFDVVTATLRALYFRVEGPEQDPRQGIARLLRCHSMVMLPNWAESSWATLCRDIADELSMQVLEWREVETWAQVTPFRQPRE